MLKRAQLSLGLSVGIAGIIIIAVIVSMFIGVYNKLVVADNQVDGAKAQIETVLQRRLDLIPNLVSTVKGYAKHEEETLTKVIEARAKAQNALKSVSDKKGLTAKDTALLSGTQASLTGAVMGVFAIVERYPDLKASSNFMALQDQLEGTENRIAVTRMRYNDLVREFNTMIKKFPGAIVATMLSFNEKGYFQAEDKADVAPKVSF